MQSVKPKKSTKPVIQVSKTVITAIGVFLFIIGVGVIITIVFVLKQNGNSSVEQIQTEVIKLQRDVLVNQEGLNQSLDSSRNAETIAISASNQIGTYSTKISDVETDMENLQSSFSPLVTDMSNLQSSFSPIVSSLSTVETGLSTVETGLTNLQSTVTPLVSDLSTVETGLTNLQSTVTPLVSGLSTVETGLTNLQSTVTPLVSDLSTVETTANNALTATQTAKDYVFIGLTADVVVSTDNTLFFNTTLSFKGNSIGYNNGIFTFEAGKSYVVRIDIQTITTNAWSSWFLAIASTGTRIYTNPYPIISSNNRITVDSATGGQSWAFNSDDIGPPYQLKIIKGSGDPVDVSVRSKSTIYIQQL